VFAVFSIGLPLAQNRDYIIQQQVNNSGFPSNSVCPQDPNQIPGCSSFIANGVQTDYFIPNGDTSWGPDTGWILSVIGGGLVLICSILMCLFGVPKDD